MFPQKLVARLRDRLVQSRFLTISVTLHLILLLVLGTVVIVRPLPPKEDGEFVSDGPLVQESPVAAVPRPDKNTPAIDKTAITTPMTGIEAPKINQIIQGGGSDFVPPPIVIGRGSTPSIDHRPTEIDITSKIPRDAFGLTKQDRDAIGKFREAWVVKSGNSSKADFEFTAYIGRYQGGNWDSTVRLSKGEIVGGSLPNLLYVTTQWTKERIKTNERQVKAIPLDSDELFTTNPPFIFLTGTRDFQLTDKEVENLQKYIRLGGAIWGDSSVPGERSRFDLAFQREMKRVVGEKEAKFETLPDNHPILADGYIEKFRGLPSGINNYREPVRVMRWGGEIAVIHTRNDYGDMWQIGLDKNGKIDLSKNLAGQYVAMNPNLWENRGVYVRNIEQPAVEDSYKFGINMIMHLLTRWGTRLGNSAPL